MLPEKLSAEKITAVLDAIAGELLYLSKRIVRTLMEALATIITRLVEKILSLPLRPTARQYLGRGSGI